MFFISTSTSRFPFQSFFTFFGFDQLNIIFSIREGDSWSSFVSCNDSIMKWLWKSVSVSKSELDRYLFDFLKEEAMICVYFSLVLCSTTHHGVQFVLGINWRGNPFTLVEMGDITTTLIKREILSLSQFLVFITLKFNSGQNSLDVNTINPQPLPLSTYKIEGLGIVLQEQIE